MQYYLRLATLVFLVATSTALAQGPEGRQFPLSENERRQSSTREIEIPSGAAIDEMLARNPVPNPAKVFSPNDAIADQQLEKRAKKIDSEVMKGICTGC